MQYDGASYDAQRARSAFLYDSYLGGDHYRNPSFTVLSQARIWETFIRPETGEPDRRIRRTYASYMVPHPSESDIAFETRLAIAAFPQIVAPIVDAYSESVTANVTRDLGEMAPYLDDVDMRGTTYGDYMEEVAKWTAVYGYTATIIDTPDYTREPAGAPRSQADEIARGVKPCLVLVHPTAIAWVEVDDVGQLTEFAYVDQPYRAVDVQAYSQKVQVRVWMRDQDSGQVVWQVREGIIQAGIGLGLAAGISEQKAQFAKIIREGVLPSQYGEDIPIEFAYYRRVTASRWPIGISLIEDAADIARLIYNKLSWESEIHRNAGFPTLAIPTADTGGQLDPRTRVEIGPAKAIPYSSSAGAPQWIQPAADQSRDLRESCMYHMQLAMRSAGLELAADTSAQVQSGEALRIRSRDFEARAKRYANHLQRFEDRILDRLSRLLNMPAPPMVTYPKRFTLPDRVEDLQAALSLLNPATMPIELGVDAKLVIVRQALDAALTVSDEQMTAIMGQIRKFLEADAANIDAMRAAQTAIAQARANAIVNSPDDESNSPPDGIQDPATDTGPDGAPSAESMQSVSARPGGKIVAGKKARPFFKDAE